MRLKADEVKKRQDRLNNGVWFCITCFMALYLDAHK